MLRALVFASLALAVPPAGSGQTISVLHIKVVLVDAERKTTPVPRHALLISDNPASAAPRLIVTAVDGTANVRLRPGNYTVESDRSVAFNGKAYQWRQTIDIVAGRDAVLDLTADNAEVEAVAAAATPTSAAPLEADPAFLLPQWQDSVVALWTSTTRASGFVIKWGQGRVWARSHEPASDRHRDVGRSPAHADGQGRWDRPRGRSRPRCRGPLDRSEGTRVSAGLCRSPARTAATPAVVNGQEIFAIGAPLRQPKGMTSGSVSRVDASRIVADFILALGSAGGPVFSARGELLGMTSLIDEKDENAQSRRRESRVVRSDAACDVVAAAEKKMKSVARAERNASSCRARAAVPGRCAQGRRGTAAPAARARTRSPHPRSTWPSSRPC